MAAAFCTRSLWHRYAALYDDDEYAIEERQQGSGATAASFPRARGVIIARLARTILRRHGRRLRPATPPQGFDTVAAGCDQSRRVHVKLYRLGEDSGSHRTPAMPCPLEEQDKDASKGCTREGSQEFFQWQR